MHTFRTALRIVSRHWLYVVVYLGLLSIMGVFVTAGYTEGDNTFHESYGKVAIIDRDGSLVSRGLAAYLATFSVTGIDDEAGLTEVEDSTAALTDLVAQDVVSYVLIVPEGFGEALMQAAVAGSELPALETAISYQSGTGVLMDVRARQYLQTAYGYAGSIGKGDQGRTVELTAQTMAEQVSVETIKYGLGGFSERLVTYFSWCTYPMFSAAAVLVSVLMESLNEEDVRRRALAAPTTASSRSLQTFLACVLLGVFSWAWIVGLGLVVDGREALQNNGTQVVLMAAAMLAYALVSVSIGFLLGQLGFGEMAANAIGNVGGMAVSILGGAWMPLEYLGKNMLAVAHLTPSFWTTQALRVARDLTSITSEGVLASLRCTGVVFLFALAFTLMAFAAGRAKAK